MQVISHPHHISFVNEENAKNQSETETETITNNSNAREVLCSEHVASILAENFVVWGWNLTHPDSKEILKKILSRHVTSNVSFFIPSEFPFFCVLANIRGSLVLLDSSVGEDLLY